jgi:hypothetical protein
MAGGLIAGLVNGQPMCPGNSPALQTRRRDAHRSSSITSPGRRQPVRVRQTSDPPMLMLHLSARHNDHRIRPRLTAALAKQNIVTADTTLHRDQAPGRGTKPNTHPTAPENICCSRKKFSTVPQFHRSACHVETVLSIIVGPWAFHVRIPQSTSSAFSRIVNSLWTHPDVPPVPLPKLIRPKTLNVARCCSWSHHPPPKTKSYIYPMLQLQRFFQRAFAVSQYFFSLPFNRLA